ncbi:hypothetical protein MSAN_00071800 [Mycena sanguinolenta]|uniref:Uncharacterized protein n=1 Tax=Mycena sanguinolenta TaxID=230812 RepID=A0A8H7DJI5_9AGAR|nr:hypothetical protein MSAN_00071800 [Mycena sanguinolenta]
MSSAKSSRLLEEILQINPLEQNYTDIVAYSDFADKTAWTNALNVLRTRLRRTVKKPLAVVLDKFPPVPDLKIKILLLRAYIRRNKLDHIDGRARRGFWPNLDKWYGERIPGWGKSFGDSEWTRYIQAVMASDKQFAPPLHKPLFTSAPLVASAPLATSSPLITSSPPVTTTLLIMKITSILN